MTLTTRIGVTLVLLALVPLPALAATGSDVSFGYTWRDNADGAVRDGVIFGGTYGEILGPADDQVWGPFTLDIANAFPFYGNSYTEFWISDNGWLSFTDPGGNSHPGAQLIPEAGTGPPEMVAPFWGDLELRTGSLIRYGYTNATLDAYRIQFAAWDKIGNQAVGFDLLLFPDGRIKVQYSVALGDVFEGSVTVGLDSEAAADGGGPVNDGASAAGVNIQGGTVIEFLPPPVLPAACGSLASIPCGITNDSTGGGPGVFYYACDPQRWSAEGAVFNLNLAESASVDFLLTSSTELDLFIMEDCDEQACFTGPVDAASLLLGAGDYQLAVDGLLPAEDGAFTLDVNCAPVGTIVACDDAAAGDTATGVSRWDSYPCAPGVDLSGPETVFSVTVPTNTNLSATLSNLTADLDVIIMRTEAGELMPDQCVSWGPDAAVAWNAQPGEYLIVVDGVAGATGTFDIQTNCRVGLDCNFPAGTVDFSMGRVQQVMGDNSGGANSVEIYGCDSVNLYPSPEEIWEVILDQPGQIAVVQTDGEPLDFFFLTECNEGACAGASGTTSCSTPLDPGTYWLVVDGQSGGAGPYELLMIFEEQFNRWDACEDPVPPETELTTETSPVWILTDNAFCKYNCDDGSSCDPMGAACADGSTCSPNRNALGVDCTFAMYVTVDCGTALHLPLYDCEGGHVRIFDVFNGEYLDLDARSPTWASSGTEIQWQDADCDAGSDPRWNEVVTDISFTRPEGLCGVFRLEFINHSGNVWELFANCDGSRGPAFNISDSLCNALAGYQPLPNVSLTSVIEDYNCPDLTVTYEITNDGCAPAENVEVRLTDSGNTVYSDMIAEILPGETLLRMFSTPVPTPSNTLLLNVDLDDTLLECDEPAASDRSSCDPVDGTDIQTLLGCAATCTVDVRPTVTPSVICTDGVMPVTLDACATAYSACSGLEYAYVEIGSGDMPMFGPECSWVLDPPPTADTQYSLIARCLDDPDCSDFQVVTVTVQRRPDFDPALVTARDRTNCNLGIQVEWGEATFYGPGGTGVYNVYRSPTGCDTDLEIVTLGITELEFFDTPPLPDTPYFYVVEAEDASMNSSCMPAGPTNGGSTTRVSANNGVCTEVVDLLAPRLDLLPRVGQSLRVGGTDPGFGVRQYGETFVQMFWTPDRDADMGADEHFHVYRSDQPDGTYSTVTDDAPPEYSNEFLDLLADHPNDGQAHVWYYLVFTADGCDGENIDYDRFCTDC